MAENNDTPVQPVQANESTQAAQTGSVQAVQTANMPLREGYQPLPIEVKKGYQAIDTPPSQSPPQSIASDIPVVVIESSDVAGSGASVQAQANSATAAQSSKQTG